MCEKVPMEMTIKKVLNIAHSWTTLYHSNEEATKQHLVLPILSALGWDIFSPEVLPEERVRAPSGYYKVDYSLRVHDKTIAYIEVKSLGTDIFTNKGALYQLINYCAINGVDIGILTNGVQWILIKAYESGKSLEERIILRIDLENMDINDVIEGLRYLTKENLESGVLQKIKKFSSSTRVIKEEYGDNDKEKGRAKSLSKSLSPPNGAKLLDELTPEDLKGRPKLLEIYVYHKGKWYHVPVERNAWAMSLFAVVRFLWEHGFDDLYVPTYVERTYVRSPGATDVIGPWHVYRPENGSVAVSKLKILEEKTGVKIAVKVLKRY